MCQCLAWGSLSTVEVRAWAALPPPMLFCHTRAVADLGEPSRPSHISKTVLSTVKKGPPDLIKSRTFVIRFRLAL